MAKSILESWELDQQHEAQTPIFELSLDQPHEIQKWENSLSGRRSTQ
jgi:hypothetical protein